MRPGRHHPYHPPFCPSPMQPPLCSCLKAWAPNLPSWQPLKRTTKIWGSYEKFGSFPHTTLPSINLLSSIGAAATVVCTGLKINARPSWSEAQQAPDWQIFALNTNTDCFGKGAVCCHSICPPGICCYISASTSWQAPPVLFLSLLPVQELCHWVSQRDAKPVGSHLKVTLTSLPLLWLPWLVPRLFRQVEE